ncbi:GNAT family N-acetyltransferase [Aliikangiella marina]|uniref:GNAT family N-acetyltransferase n=1 Tax=Aliikangiella marina TaxID=1712262 RepID=A0A545THN6_9GAMM|nr:GNAT family N-acetyltransferase [Aliikangiella marina]TQV76743.1 GNAT family N-acetyltransferase [Aliikangiella marina]
MTVNIPETSRLKFKFVTERDAEFLFDLDQDPMVMKFINGGIKHSRERINEVFLPRIAKFANQEKGWGLWQVIEKVTGKAIGWILVRPNLFFSDNPEFDNLEVGWRFFQSSWGKGYATEAAEAVIEVVSKYEEVTRISAIAVEENLASINIMRKLGMKFVKKYLHKDPLGDSEVVYYEKTV